MIRTVLGDIASATAGVVDSHDHLFLASPALPGEALDDADAAQRELVAFQHRGGGTVVQWTPFGLHRDLAALRRISASSGVHVVAATGRHRRALYPADAEVRALGVDRLASVFITDIEERGCGLVKIGTGGADLASDEADALQAAAIAHRVTGAPIAIHLEGGSGADGVLHRLTAAGVPARSIVLGHLGRNPDERRIVEAAESGAWLCFDAPSARHPISVDRLARLLSVLTGAGHGAQLLLGADTTAASSRAAPFENGPAGLLRGTVEPLRVELGDSTLDAILVGNSARAWALDTDSATPALR
ncbi:MAG TPA: aryldialkylphosphatase [Plantibacter sp.]|uniref:phosphotriesterase family protein n=1 Tax=unclassified Plantibacter TaxID=2624265 RepID=UPI002C5ED4DB|nr:aryldialkylphosphatase [Plantibacter sp.]